MSLNPRVVNETPQYVYLEWDPDLMGQGYRLYIDGQAVSRTFKPDASSTRFHKPDAGTHHYGVQKMDVVDALEEVVHPTPSNYVVTQTITEGAALSGNIGWHAIPADVAATKRVEFFIDGVLRWTENISPYHFGGDDQKLDTTTLSDGPHSFEVHAHHSDGRIARVAATATVGNAIVPSPPAEAIWNGDFSTGDFSQYGNSFVYGGTFDGIPPVAERYSVDASIDGVTPPGSCSRLARLLCAPGDQYGSSSGWRTELRQYQPIQPRNTGWDGAMVMAQRVPADLDVNTNYWLLGGGGLHAAGGGTQGPLVGPFFDEAGHAYLYLRSGPHSIDQPNVFTDTWRGKVLDRYEKDVWHVFAWRYKLSGTSPTGHYELWHGRRGIDTQMRRLLHLPNIKLGYDNGGAYWQFGIYRNQAGTGLSRLYLAGLREYRALADALVWAEQILAG